MEIVQKVTSAPVGVGFEYVLSDATVDSYGDIVEASGWDLARFDTNPIALFNHNSDAPIGRWTNVRVEGGKLKGRLEFAKAGTSPRIDEIRSLAEQGILRATSVGFAPLAASPLKSGGKRYTKQLLHECSLVSVPANPNAVQLAKSLHVSSDTMSLVFGEHANSGDGIKRRGTHGEHAAPSNPIRKTAMKTLSQRIEDAQNDLVAARDVLVELNAADVLDLDAIDEQTERTGLLERTVATLKASEAKLGGAVASSLATPAVVRQPLHIGKKDLSGVDLLVRAMTVRAVSHFGQKSIDQVLEERYRNDERTAIVAKADQTIGTTTVSGWASELVQTVYADFLDALLPVSFYAQLRNRGIRLSFDGYGTVSIPSRTQGGASGGFVAEGAPIRVGRITTAATTMTAKKMGVIVPFSRELAKRSTPAIEALVRQAIIEDTAITLDQAMIDATAASTARPAGLLNGVAATASGVGGGDYEAVVADLKALLAPFIAANAADGIVVLMNPAQGLAMSMMPGGDGVMGSWMGPIQQRVTFIESGNVPAGRLIALRAADLATAMGDAPEFDVSETATVHMEDTTPLEIVSGTGPTTADPVRSFFQTATVGVRMLMDVSWQMRRSGMVRWIDTTSY